MYYLCTYIFTYLIVQSSKQAQQIWSFKKNAFLNHNRNLGVNK